MEDPLGLPIGAVRFPIELKAPPGFDPDDPATWPKVHGRVEWVGGRLLYMPPCGDTQQDVSVDVVLVIGTWARDRPGFVVGGNEAGMILGEDRRGAEAAVWGRKDLGPHTGGFRRVPPILAVEVAGLDEGEPELREKARWYLQHGVEIVWLVLPEPREVVVLRTDWEARLRKGERLPASASLPGLEPEVAELFRQIDAPPPAAT